jgi:hypothetical protein
MASPNPVPDSLVVKNGSKMLGITDSEIGRLVPHRSASLAAMSNPSCSFGDSGLRIVVANEHKIIATGFRISCAIAADNQPTAASFSSCQQPFARLDKR